MWPDPRLHALVHYHLLGVGVLGLGIVFIFALSSLFLGVLSFFFFFITLGLESGNTKVHEP